MAVTSPDKRFILTTREYILNQAKTKYEVLNRSEFSTGEATVLISDYDRPTKAKLLYNHLWFHGVDLAKIRAIIETKTHHKIIAHEHFLPRIIEWMTQKTRLEQVPDKGYPAAFVEMLDHPNQVWQHAYDSQIGVRERTLLIALSTLSHSVSIPELHRMHLAFAKAYCQDRFSQESTEAAIRTLDGSFVLTSRGRDGPLVALHNPSVRDFLNTVLGRRDVFESVIGSLCYLQQYERMSDLFHKHEELGPLLDLAVDRMVELAANSPTRWIPFGGQWTSWPTSQATQVANALARRKLVLTSSECQTLDALIDSSAKTTSELTGLLSALGPLAAPEDLSRIVAKYEDRIVNSIHDTDDLEAVIGIEDLLPERERTFTRLADCATSILEGNCDNLHEIAQTRTDAEDLKSKVSQICETLAIAEYPYIDRIDNYLEELRGPDEDSEYESYRDQGIDARSQEDDVDDLFETLDTEKSDDPA